MLTHLGAIDRPHHIQAALSWEFQVNGWEKFASTLPNGAVMDFKFENLLQEPNETVAALTEFLGIPFTDACRDYIGKELDTSKARQHRENDPQQVAEVIEAIGDTLKKFGYD